jgi:sugar lactone lactonase YvrE
MRPVSRKTINLLAASVIFGFVAIISISLLVSNMSGELFGPTVLAEDDQGFVYVNIGPTIYRLDATGRIVDTVSQQELGLPSDKYTDLEPLPDGRLLIALARPGRIYSCILSERRCNNYLQQDHQVTQTLKMTWHRDKQQLFVVDADAGKILIFDDQGRLVKSGKGGHKGLALPNTPIISRSGDLVIADTNHHRFVAIDADTINREIWQAPVKSLLASPGRTWPTDITETENGEFWLINDGSQLRYGDVIVFDQDRNPVKRLDLDQKWDPVKLIARDDDILLASFANYYLLSVTLDGDRFSVFGSDEFRSLLQEAYNHQRKYDNWWDIWVWVIVAPLLGLLIYVLYLDKLSRNYEFVKRIQNTEEISAKFDTDGVYWLPHNQKFLKKMKLFKWMLPAIILLCVLTLMPVMDQLDMQMMLLFVFIICGLFVPMTIFALVTFKTLTGSCVGVDKNSNILLKSGEKNIVSPPSEIYFNQRYISSGNVFVVTRTNLSIFDDDAFKKYIEPLLIRAYKLSPTQSFLHQVKNRPGFVRNTVLLGLYFLLVLLILNYFDN